MIVEYCTSRDNGHEGSVNEDIESTGHGQNLVVGISPTREGYHNGE